MTESGKGGKKPPKDRNISRHRPGYMTEYMRAYRAQKKAEATLSHSKAK